MSSFYQFHSSVSTPESAAIASTSAAANKCNMEIQDLNVMNSSIDEFLAEYFGPEYRAKHYGTKQDNNPQPLQAPMIGNFDFGGDALMDSIIHDDEGNLDYLPIPMSKLQLDSKQEESTTDIDKNKIVNVRTRRKSLSYDIVFNEKHAVQIRIVDSPKSNSAREKGENKHVQLLEKELKLYKLRNAELEQEVAILKQKVQLGETVVQRLEIELAETYMFDGNSN